MFRVVVLLGVSLVQIPTVGELLLMGLLNR